MTDSGPAVQPEAPATAAPSTAATPAVPRQGWREWRPGRAFLAEAALVLGLVVLAIGVLRWYGDDQDFSVDESRWISTSRYFWITLLDRDVFGPAWQPNYLVLTHPPVARYAIGFGLWVQGWTPDQLNGRYDTDRSRDYNRRQGNIPGRELLDAARRVVFVYALASTLLLYPIGRLMAGPAGGALAVILALANPLLPALWTRALAESVLAFFTLLAFWLSALLAARTSQPGMHFRWSVGLGLSLGLAAATKLTGVLGGVGLAVFVAAQHALRWWTLRRWPGIGPWPDAALMAVLVFMLANPLLYPDPLGRSVMLFLHRRDEMRQQAIGTPRLAVENDLGVRAALMHERTYLDYGTFQTWLGVPLDGLLTVVGLGIALAVSWRAARRGSMFGPPMLLVCWMVATYAISTINLGFDSSHYVALPVLWSVLLEALALATLVPMAVRWVRSRAAAGPASAPA